MSRAALVRIALLTLLAVALGGCTGSHRRATPSQSSTTSGGSTSGTGKADPETGYAVPLALWRAFQPPALVRGTCRPATEHPLSPAFGPGLGSGPIYPVGTDNGVLPVRFPPDPSSDFAGSDYSGQKVLWVGDPRYQGPVLIRGRPVDGSANAVRFERGVSPQSAMQFRPGLGTAVSDTEWRNWPSYTRVRALGCYAWQVDGTNFSYSIIFRVVKATTP